MMPTANAAIMKSVACFAFTCSNISSLKPDCNYENSQTKEILRLNKLELVSNCEKKPFRKHSENPKGKLLHKPYKQTVTEEALRSFGRGLGWRSGGENVNRSAIVFLIALSFLLALTSNVQAVGAQPPNALWTKTYGGAGLDQAVCVIRTSDGGYAIAGNTVSTGSGSFDFWLIKTDANGNPQWNKTYGGTGFDEAKSLIQTNEGGYAIAGSTSSYGAGNLDFWLVKTNSNGVTLWNKTYGGIGVDYAFSVIQTGDGGYALAGVLDPNVSDNRVFWLVKTDSIGKAQWNKTYDEAYNDKGAQSYTDEAHCVIQTANGGYAIAGNSVFYAGGFAFLSDFWLVKTDAAGNAQWNKTYGEQGDDGVWSVVETVDGEYALAGTTDMFPYGTGNQDFWLVKTDGSGNAKWNKTYGGSSNDIGSSMVQTGDGGYAIAGSTDSFGAGSYDFWLVRTDADGNALWNNTYGGTGVDGANSVIATTDGGYAIAGYTESYGADGQDFWLVRTAIDVIPEFSPSMFLAILIVAVKLTTILTGKRFRANPTVTFVNLQRNSQLKIPRLSIGWR